GMRIILYDNAPYHSAARAGWMCRHFGIEDVAILDGSLAIWKAEGRPVESGWRTPVPGNFRERPVGRSVRTRDDILRNLEGGDALLIDARGTARFSGAEKDPR